MVKPAILSESIVKAFNVFKDSSFSLYMTLKRLNNIEQLALKSSDKALRHRIVVIALSSSHCRYRIVVIALSSSHCRHHIVVITLSSSHCRSSHPLSPSSSALGTHHINF